MISIFTAIFTPNWLASQKFFRFFCLVFLLGNFERVGLDVQDNLFFVDLVLDDVELFGSLDDLLFFNRLFLDGLSSSNERMI